MPKPEQIPDESRRPESGGLPNGIRGLEDLALLGAPAGGSAETARKLSPKVRRSIERKIVNRQRKIEGAIDALAACTTQAEFARLVQEEKLFDEIVKWLVEQEEIAERESLGNIDPAPFEERRSALENLQRAFLPRLIKGEDFDVKSEVARVRELLVPRGKKGDEGDEGKTVAAGAMGAQGGGQSSERIGTADVLEEKVEKTLSAALREPEIAKRVAARVTRDLREERHQTEKVETRAAGALPEHSPSFEQIIADVRRAKNLKRRERREDGGWREVPAASAYVAEQIRQKAALFAGEGFKKNPPATRRREVLEFIEQVTTNARLKQDLREAFVALGVLPLEKAQRGAQSGGAEGLPPRKAAALRSQTLGVFNRSAMRSAAESGEADFVEMQKRIASGRGGKKSLPQPVPSPSVPSGVSPVAAASSFQAAGTVSMSNEELEQMGLAGTGWKREAPAVAPAAGATEATPSVPAPVGERGAAARRAEAPLAERGAEGEPTPDNPAFLRFLASVEETAGKRLDFGNEAALAPFREAFAARGEVAQLFSELYAGEMKKTLGPDASLPGIARAVSAHLERLSREDPGRVAEYRQLFSDSVVLQKEVEELQRRRGELVSPEEAGRELAGMMEKQRTLELAKATNKFWSGAGIFTVAKEKREARRQAQAMGYGKSFLGITVGIDYQEKPWQRAEASVAGGIHEELRRLRSEIDTVAARGAGGAAAERSLSERQNRLAEMRKKVFVEGAMQNEVSELVRKGAVAAFEHLLRAPRAAVPEELEKYDRAEKSLAELVAAAERGGGADIFDAVRDIGDPDTLRARIREGAEALARRIISEKIKETLRDPSSPGRFSALQRELSALFERGKIGGYAGSERVKGFISRELSEFIRQQEELGEIMNPQERETARLRSAVVRSVLVARRVRAGAETARAPAGGTPSAGAPQTPPVIPVPPVISAFERVPSQPSSSLAASHPRAERAGTGAPIPERLAALTFQELLNLDDARLGEVIRRVSVMGFLVDALSDQEEAVVQRIRGFLSERNQEIFDGRQKLGFVSGEPWIKECKAKILAVAREALGEQKYATENAGANAAEPYRESYRNFVGSTFVECLKEDGPAFHEIDLQRRLEKTVPGAEVRAVYRPTSAQEFYWLEQREGSALRSLLVTVKDKHYLVPAPASGERFETVAGFGGTATPGNLNDFVPAEMVRNGQRWEVKVRGMLQ